MANHFYCSGRLGGEFPSPSGFYLISIEAAAAQCMPYLLVSVPFGVLSNINKDLHFIHEDFDIVSVPFGVLSNINEYSRLTGANPAKFPSPSGFYLISINRICSIRL